MEKLSLQFGLCCTNLKLYCPNYDLNDGTTMGINQIKWSHCVWFVWRRRTCALRMARGQIGHNRTYLERKISKGITAIEPPCYRRCKFGSALFYRRVICSLCSFVFVKMLENVSDYCYLF